MKDYDTWSFKNRSFLTAIAASLLWHFFWFFAVTITVNPDKHRFRSKPVIVSLGPVLDDRIFRTLVDTRPQASQTFYRRLSDFSSPAEVEVKTLPRTSPGEIVSLPFGKKMSNSMRTLIGGDKLSPDFLRDVEEEEKRKHEKGGTGP